MAGEGSVVVNGVWMSDEFIVEVSREIANECYSDADSRLSVKRWECT